MSNPLKRSPSPPPEGNEQQGRQRSRAACAPCRQRKRKCDGRMPCATCVRYEYRCEYSTTTKRQSYSGDAPAPPQPLAESSVYTPPSIVQLQKHPLTAPGARFHHRGILDPVKTRFVRANSAIAFPRILGMDMESDSIPRLHSFAWHVGIRNEAPEETVDVSTLLTWSDMQRLGSVYFKVVKPELGVLEESEFMEQAAARFSNTKGFSDIDACILGVAALGSFFSPNPHPAEDHFVLGARGILIQHTLNHGPTTNHVAGWILRTIYLRLAARPHGSWMSSSITLHQAEASGLHKEMQTIAVVYPAAPAADHKLSKARRRLFWIARALNIIISFEYGRSRVNFDVITTKKFAAESGSHAHQFVELAELLPNDFVDREREPDPPSALVNALSRIEEMPFESSFLTMLRADLAFAIYRRLWLMSLTDAKDRADTVIGIGKAALTASTKLMELGWPWWNIVHTPFQFLCVVIAVGTPRSLSHIQEIMALLRKVAMKFDTHMVREAYNQASALVRMFKIRKEKELEAVGVMPDAPPFADHPSVGSSGMQETAPNLDWTMDLPFEWDIFLNPDLVVSTQQPQSAVGAAMNGHLAYPTAPQQHPQPQSQMQVQGPMT
ncbi:Hypothetical protein R9X50_00674400 [Acrodontium crateriforme]|uniref:Zn(2)-C6 fungal-type domain-containing protein n=1 Tax=Acrodontium crateriforme TaxID=150365 RepID=A0AAQ3R711_9PEZI|nr:Hypothetical protein R9X50_00674400 [Acrodontium crateriforme]